MRLVWGAGYTRHFFNLATCNANLGGKDIAGCNAIIEVLTGGDFSCTTYNLKRLCNLQEKNARERILK